MESIRKLLRSPVTTAALFVLAAALLLTAGIGGTRAALTYFSDTYQSGVEMFHIGVTLAENGTPVSWRDYREASDGDAVGEGNWAMATGVLLEHMLPEGESLQIGRSYPEALSVTNSGSIDEYVRVSVYKYWTDDAAGEVKNQSLDPGLIDLHFVYGSNGWVRDPDAETDTDERTVLYYRGIVAPGGSTPAFTDTLRIDGGVLRSVSRTETRDGEYTVITNAYEYDGKYFWIEATVDAVQTHNAAEAIRSAWGVDPAVIGVQ